MPLGIPAPLLVAVVALAWGAIGGYIVGTSRSRWVVPYVLVLFTLPACLGVVFAQAIVLILENLGA